MNKRYQKKYRIAVNCRFIAEKMFCLIPQFLRLWKMRYGLSKRPECVSIKVGWHDLAFSIRLMKFAILPAIFISIS